MSLLQLSDDVLVDIFNSYLGNAKALKLLGNRSLNNHHQHFQKTSLVPEDNSFPSAEQTERLGTKGRALVQPVVVIWKC